MGNNVSINENKQTGEAYFDFMVPLIQKYMIDQYMASGFHVWYDEYSEMIQKMCLTNDDGLNIKVDRDEMARGFLHIIVKTVAIVNGPNLLDLPKTADEILNPHKREIRYDSILMLDGRTTGVNQDKESGIYDYILNNMKQVVKTIKTKGLNEAIEILLDKKYLSEKYPHAENDIVKNILLSRYEFKFHPELQFKPDEKYSQYVDILKTIDDYFDRKKGIRQCIEEELKQSEFKVSYDGQIIDNVVEEKGMGK